MIFTTAFTRVIFHFMGLPSTVPTLFTEFCVLLLLAKALYLQLFIYNKPLRAFGFFPMLGILVVSCISFLFNKPELLPAILFLRQTFVFYLFFVALQNLNLSEKTIQRINQYIIFLFLIQLPAALIKYTIVGQDEYWVGTVSWQGGQLSTMLPLFASSFLFAFYFFSKNWKYLFLVACFLLFGIAGQKRALALLMPVVAGVIWYLYGKRKVLKRGLRFKVSQLKYLLVIGLIGYLGIFGASQLLKSEMYGGHLNIKKVFDYVVWYNTRNEIALYGHDNPDNSMGRYTITVLSLERLTTSGVSHQLIGFGPGTMILSPHIREKTAKEVFFEHFGMKGATPAFVIYLLQIGFLGVTLLVYFFLKLFRKAYMRYRISSNVDFRMIALGFMGATFVFLLDFFIYGKSTLLVGVLTPAYFYVASIIVRREYHHMRFLVPFFRPYNSRKKYVPALLKP
jgi:hypothetical protein